jgi:Zn-dependent protease with chaperone function
MDFFQQQEKARKKTKWLILYFSIAVVLIIAAVYAVVIFASTFATHRYNQFDQNYQSTQFSWWNPSIFLCTAIGTVVVILCGSAYKIQQLAEGGSALAESLGGRLVASNTTDPDERKLLNVVEEMSIASSVPMPQVYVLDQEQGINAFAAGHSTSDAVVAVTHGCVKLLNRDELQGVIGHEFSHILNGDMRLNLRLIGILFGILCIATIGRIAMQARGRNAAPAVITGILLLCIGSIGVLFGRLIQAAVSRQREFLADASSVQFTRNPSGLSGALQKIGGYGFGSQLTSDHAPDAGHIFFGNGNPRPIFSLMVTHPPLEERIHAIDQTWDGKFKQVDMQSVRADIARHPQPPRPVFMDGKMIVLGGMMAQGAQDASGPVKKYALPNVGNPTPLHLRYAEQMRDSLPDAIRAAVREPLDAAALIYAMLLSNDDNQRAQQLAELGKRAGTPVSDKTAALFPDVSKIAAHTHLPMVNLALGALKQLTVPQYDNFSKTLDWLINSDGKIEMFEFVLQKIVLRNLDSQFHNARKPVVQFYSIKPLVPDCALILSALANLSSNDPAEVQKAFDAGAPYLRSPDDTGLQLVSRAECGLDKIDAALNRLGQAVPNIKRNLLDACLHVIAADGVILEAEAELLRAIADTLDCPVPPFVATE